MKIAVYVEGQAELIFVRELLYKWNDYDPQRIGFKCYNLRGADAPGYDAPYQCGGMDSANFYEIVNVGTDKSVLSKAIDNAGRYKNLGYDRIVVLRDMYSDNYHEAVYEEYKSRVIVPEINARFINGGEASIAAKGYSGYINLNFAIMEIEAWLLGMGWYLEREDGILTPDYMSEELGFDINQDPENTIYHPAKELGKIYTGIGQCYDKHAHEVNAIMGKIDKRDFMDLLESPKCASFNVFMSTLIP